MPAPKTRAGSGLTVRKNSDEVQADNIQDLDFVEGAGVQLGLDFDRKEGVARLTITPTGVSSDVHVEVTPSDTNPSGLNDKLGVTAPISKVTENAGGNELLRLSHGGQHSLSDILGTLSGAQHGTIVSGDLHPEYETSAEAQAKVDAHAAGADPHAAYQKESEKDAASGYAGLTAGTKLNVAQMQEVIAHADLTDSPADAHHAQAHKAAHATAGGDALFSSHEYVFLPDAAIDADVVAGAQKQILTSLGANETLARIVIHATTAGGTALTVTLEQLQSGGVGVEDTDSAGTWTTIKAITVTASNKTVIDSAPAATILARGALRINIGGTVTGWKNVTATYEVKRPLTT